LCRARDYPFHSAGYLPENEKGYGDADDNPGRGELKAGVAQALNSEED
jgi:hypothetical protein